MSTFARNLANFERYLAHAEPRVFPQASTIISRTYRRGGSGLGDAYTTFPDTSSSGSSPTATTDALAAFFNTVGGLLQQPQQTQQQLAQLQYQAEAEQAQAQAAQANNSTMLLIGGAVLAVISLGLITRRR